MQIADWAYGLLRPGGKLILGNFNIDKPGALSNVPCARHKQGVSPSATPRSAWKRAMCQCKG